MDSLRTFLALTSVLVGLGLVGLAVWLWRSPARRVKSARVALIYGGLFVLVGVLLSLRESDQAGARWRSLAEDTTTADSISVPQSNLEAEHAGELEPQARTASEELAASASVLPLQEASTAHGRRARSGGHAQERAAPLSEPPMSGDPLYAAVLRAFDGIEAWFYKYGSPASPDRKDRGIRDLADTLSFPEVRFDAGTANLAPESRRSLARLAAHLKALPGPRLIDIQAHVSGPGPEPFNYILTQARAEVVRDFLVSEGVDSRWLTTSAMGSEGMDSLVVGSRIRFEVRR